MNTTVCIFEIGRYMHSKIYIQAPKSQLSMSYDHILCFRGCSLSGGSDTFVDAVRLGLDRYDTGGGTLSILGVENKMLIRDPGSSAV